MRHGHGVPLLLLVLGFLLPPVEAGAQVEWAWVDALGYGGAGAALGVAANWNRSLDDLGTGIVVTGALAGAGVALGAYVGSRADRALDRGEPLGAGHRGAVVGGSVMAGATLGALGSAAFINSEGEGTPFGSDESTFALFAAGGAALGGLFAWWRRDDLRPRPPPVAPYLDVEGRPGVRLSVRF